MRVARRELTTPNMSSQAPSTRPEENALNTIQMNELRNAIQRGQEAIDCRSRDAGLEVLPEVLRAAREALGLKAIAYRTWTVTLPDGSAVDVLVESNHVPQTRFVRVVDLAGLEAYA